MIVASKIKTDLFVGRREKGEGQTWYHHMPQSMAMDLASLPY